MLASKTELMKAMHESKSELLKQYPIKRIGVFGSWVRNQQRKNSDVDTLVEFSEPVTMFQFIDIQDYLEKLLDCKVDLVTTEALKPAIKNQVLAEVEFI